jgi:hypothetical protein
MYVRQATGIFIGYLKFSISGLISPVTSAKIRVYVLDDGPDGGGIYQVSNNYEGSTTPWVEMGLTWANAPVIQGDPLDTAGAVALDSWVEFDVSAAITGNGTYSFAIRNADSEDVKYSSKDWANPPELLIETAGGINPASQLVKISGDSQEDTAGSSLANPLVVEVRNDEDLPVGGVAVAFEVMSGGGSLSVFQQLTDSNGRATTVWTLGNTPGENTVQVTSSGLTGSPLTFTANGLALPATQIMKISGDNQEGTVGSPLASPLVVEIRNDNDLPIGGVAVAFEVLTGGGSLSGSQQITDSAGRANTVLTLGNTPSENTVQVTSSGLTGSPLTFTVNGLALPATQLVKISGDNQDGIVGSRLAQPLVVDVRDDNDSPVQGVSVAFQVLTGGGSLSITQQLTDSTGRASTVLTLANAPGANTVEASSQDLAGSPLIFTANGLGSPATQIVKISGEGQTGFVDSTLSEAFLVEVQDSANEPVSGVPVTFEVTSGGGGLLNGSLVLTDSTGLARNFLTLGSAPGINNVRVTSDGLTGSPLTFTAVALSLPPSNMVKVSGDNQSGFVDSTLAEALVVEVRNASGSPVSGVPVQFEIISGSGVLSNTQPQLTVSNGRASTFLALGDQPGLNLVRVTSDSLSGIELLFSSTGVSPPATEMVKLSGDSQSGFVDSTLSEALVVEVRNAFGGPVSGVPLHFEIVSGGGVLSNSEPQVTGADGRASNFLTLGSEAGSNSVQVTSDSLTGLTLAFSAMGLALPATQLVKISGDNQSAFTDSTLEMPFVVEVQNSAGQAVSGVVVNFEVVAGGGTLSGTQPVTTAQDGRAEAFLTLGSLSGENQVRVTSAGLSGSPMLFSATAFTQSAAQIIKISGDNQIAFLDSVLAEPLVVEVRDATGAAMAGVPITFEVSSGGGRLAESQPRVTGVDGRASSTLTVGSIAGINNVRVRSDGLAGSPLFFTAIARALPPTQLIEISGDGQNAFVDSVLAEPFVVEVRNSADEPVKGVEVLFEVSTSDGTLSNSQPLLTDDSGRASTLLTLGGLPGDNLVTAFSEGLTGSPMTFTAVGIALPPTQLVKIGGDNQNALVDSTLSGPLVVEVRNVANEPVAGATVTFEIVSGGGSLSTSSPQLTDANGRASVVWTLGPVPGANQVRVVSDGLDGSPLTFQATALPLPPSELLKISGDNQVAFLDSTLLQPLVVEVRNAADEPVSGVSIVFDVVAGGGNLSADSLLTDVNGQVSAVWTLGSEPGENRVEAYYPEFASVPISFAATALALPPTQIVKVSGDNQSAFVDSALSEPLVVEVQNAAGGPVAGATVTFEIVSGGGNLSASSPQLTDANGRASVVWTLGAVPGANQVRVVSDGLDGSPLTFLATALPLPPSQLLKISGDNQVAFVDSTLPQPLVVEVRNAADEPVSGVSIVFDVVAGGGNLSADSLLTDVNGQVSAVWTLGSEPGENSAEAHSPGVASEPISFVATALQLPPAHIVKVSGDDQSAFVDSALSEPLTVEVRNAAGGPVAGVPVNFSVVLGGGHISETEVTTGVSGRASVVLTVGEIPGANQVQVESQGLAGSPLVFAATGLALPPQQLVQVSGNNQTALVDSALAEPFVVELRDTASQPMSGARISFTVVAGGGSSSAAEDTTDSNGRASARLTLGSVAGENRVKVLADGLEESPVTFVATGLALPATQLVLLSGGGQSGQVGTALIEPLVVRALDANDIPVAGIPVSFEVTAGGGIVLNAQPQLTDMDGRAAAVLVLGQDPGTNIVMASSDGLSGSPVSFSANGVETTAELTFTPTDDSYIRSTKPNNEYGDKPTMYVIDASTDFVSFLKFSVEGLESPVRSAKLRLKAVDGGSDGGAINVVSNNQAESHKSWTEANLNWNNAPLRSTGALDSLGSVATGSVVEFDVTPAISGDGIFSFAIRGRSNDLVKYSSKEGSATPELVLSVGQAGGVSQLIEISGNDQAGAVATPLPVPFVVEARDANDLPVAGVPVRFEVISGGGTLSMSQPQVTDGSGRASTLLTLGSVAGENRVFASVEGGLLPGLTFTATGFPRQFSLTIATEGDGTVDVDPAGTVHDDRTTVTLTAQPDSGWSFAGWSGDSSGSTNPLTLTMDSDKNLTAIFNQIPPQQFTLTVTSEGSGDIALNPAGGQYTEGTLVSATATPDSGWVFSGWSGDATGVINPIAIVLDSDKSLQASFISNAVPLAFGDQFTLAEDDSLIVSAPGVLANDSDSDGDSLEVTLLRSPSNGGLILSEDGSFVYSPAQDFTGLDQFSYTVQDGKGGTASADVDLSISQVNDPPVALDDQYNVEAESSFSLSAPGVLANDTDIDSNTLIASLVAGPSHGFMNLAADGSLTYTPNAGFVGVDGFTYRVEDNTGASTVATVSIVVSPNEVAHEETVTGGSTELDFVTTAGALTGMPDHIYLVAITSKPFREVSSVSGLGLTWTRMRRQCSGRNQTGVEVWMAYGTPAAGDLISASFVSTPKNAAISVSRYSGVDVTEPISGVVSGNSNAVDGPCSGGQDQAAYAVGFTTTASKSLIYAAVALRERTHSPGVGFTERAELIHGGGGGGAGVAVQDTIVEQTSNLDIDGSFSNDVDWAMVGLELKPGGGAVQPSQYNLSITTEGAGTVTSSPAGGVYSESTIVTLTAKPDAGWALQEWGGDIGGSETPTTLLMNGNKAVIARFAEVPPVEFTLDVSVNGPGSVQLNPPGSVFPAGTQVSVTANPDSGATFTGWGGDLTGLLSPINLIMDSDRTISASFMINQPPVVVDDVYSINEDDTLDVAAPGILSNDTDPDGEPLTSTVVTGPSSGTLSLNADGSFRYIPATNFNGTANFNYRAGDTKGGSTVGTATLTVNAVNDPPVASDDAYNTSEDDTLTVATPGVAANDSDPDADGLLVSLVSEPSSGTLNLAANGSFSYVPNANFNGTDNFVYRIDDGNSGADSATAILTVNLVNDLPIAVQDNFSVAEDDTLVVPLPGVLVNDSDSDGGQLSVSLAIEPTNGSVELNPDGSFTFVPQADFHGADGFTYRLADNQGGEVSTNVTLTVNPINDAPVAVDDLYDVVVDGVLSVAAPGVLANDSDAEGDELSAIVMSAPSNGTLVLDQNGYFVYEPTSGFVGTDSFTYGVTDSSGSASIGTVQLTVNADEIKHEETLVGGSSGKSTVKISSPIDGVDGHLYLAVVSAKPYRKATELAGLGLVWTQVREQCAGRNQTGVEIWRAIGSPIGDDVVTASFSSAPKNAAISVSRYSGVDSGAPVGNIISGNTGGPDGVCSGGLDNGAYSFNFAAAQDGAVAFAAVGMRNKTHTPGGTFEERGEVSQGTGGSGAGLAAMDRLVETAGPLTVSGTFNSEVDWALIAVELRPPSSLSKSAARSETPVGDEDIAIPTSFELGQNYPNPFNPTTTISFSVPQTTELSLAIYNMRGQRVRLLVSGTVKAGRHRIIWNGRNDQERKVASGIYVYRLKARDFTAQRKLILAK